MVHALRHRRRDAPAATDNERRERAIMLRVVHCVLYAPTRHRGMVIDNWPVAVRAYIPQRENVLTTRIHRRFPARARAFYDA